MLSQGSYQVKPQTFATRASGSSKEDIFEGLHFCTLIKCLDFRESSAGLNKIGDNGQSRGRLQMYRWWEASSYWQEWCVRKYGFDNVDDDRQQVLCADYTLQEDFNQLYKRWPNTWYSCLK